MSYSAFSFRSLACTSHISRAELDSAHQQRSALQARADAVASQLSALRRQHAALGEQCARLDEVCVWRGRGGGDGGNEGEETQAGMEGSMGEHRMHSGIAQKAADNTKKLAQNVSAKGG